MGQSDFEVWQRKMIGDAGFLSLSAAQKGIVLMLTHITNGRGEIAVGKCRRGAKEIAQGLEMRTSTVNSALVAAVSAGVLTAQGGGFAFASKRSDAVAEGDVDRKGVTSENYDPSPPLPPQTPPSPLLAPDSKSMFVEGRSAPIPPIVPPSLEGEAEKSPPPPEVPETLEGKLKFILERMPGLTEKIKNIDKTVATLVEVYLDDFGEDWMVEQAKSERRWVFARQGKPVLTSKKDGNKTVLNWFRMRADDARKERKLAGQTHGRKSKPETGLDEFLHEDGGS